jgi:hypothetical protein
VILGGLQFISIFFKENRSGLLGYESMFQDCEQLALTSSTPSFCLSLHRCFAKAPRAHGGMLGIASLLLACTEKAMETDHSRI